MHFVRAAACGYAIKYKAWEQSTSWDRGVDLNIASPLKIGLGDSECINCGQCIHVCPVGAIHEQSAVDPVWQALGDPQKEVVVQVAPAVRVALGEEMGIPAGTAVTGKMYAALRRLGFDAGF